MPGPEQDRLLIGSFNLNAVGFNTGIIFEGLMDYAAVERIERLQLDDVTPAAHFLCGFLGLLNQRFARLRTIPANVDHDLGRGRILLEEQPIRDVLQIR